MSREIMRLQGICKSYKTENGEVRALDNVELTVCEGEFAAIVGRSGAGKSTLMNILGCLDTDCRGEYFLDGETVADLFFSYCSGKWWRSMEMNAGQQEVVIFRPSLRASIHSRAS